MKYLILVIVFGFAFSASANEPMNFQHLALREQKLAACESGFRPVVITDTNGKLSYNWFQFQMGTFKSFGESSGILPKGLTQKEIRILLDNPWVQAAITRWALDNGLARHWLNCSRATGII